MAQRINGKEIAATLRAEIAADNHNIVLCHFALLRESRG